MFSKRKGLQRYKNFFIRANLPQNDTLAIPLFWKIEHFVFNVLIFQEVTKKMHKNPLKNEFFLLPIEAG